jgi:RNA polymerase sigma factor (sigma-70 family)
MGVKNNIDTFILWNSFLNGDDKAFVTIYHALINALLSYGKKLTSDHELLHDAIQEIYIDLYQKRSVQHLPIINLKAYIFIALRNCIVKKILQNRIFDDKVTDHHLPEEFNIEYSFEDQLIRREISEEKRQRLQKAIITLSPGQKEIIYLKFEEELDYSEISKLMNITIESARKQLYRALFSLRQILDNESFLILFSILRKKR